jgi:hypothetical protein
MVDELLNYFFIIGGTDISVCVKEEETNYQLTFRSNYSKEKQHKIQDLCKYLNCERNEQMESYYWELTGETETDTELTIIGMMIDHYELDIIDEVLELLIIRNK